MNKLSCYLIEKKIYHGKVFILSFIGSLICSEIYEISENMHSDVFDHMFYRTTNAPANSTDYFNPNIEHYDIYDLRTFEDNRYSIDEINVCPAPINRYIHCDSSSYDNQQNHELNSSIGDKKNRYIDTYHAWNRFQPKNMHSNTCTTPEFYFDMSDSDSSITEKCRSDECNEVYLVGDGDRIL